MRNRLDLIKQNKTASKEGTQHNNRDDVTASENETSEDVEDTYVPEPGFPTLEELHKVMGYVNANVFMQFTEEDLHDIDTEIITADEGIICLGMLSPIR